MITEALITWVLSLIGRFVSPIFDQVYSGLGIEDNSARLSVPSPLWDVVSLFVQYSLILTPIALAWWVWRQIKG